MTPPERNPPLEPDAPLPWWASAMDVLALVLLVLAAYVVAESGLVLRPAGIRISVRSETRVVLWAAGLLLVRHVLVRRAPVYRWIPRAIRRAARAPGPLSDDLIAFGGTRELGPTSAGRALAYACGILLFYAVLTVLMTYPQIRQMDGVSLDTADPLLSTWRLAWIAHQLPRDPLHLFDANIFHPEPNTLAYSDAMLVPSLTVAPLVWLGVHQLLAYNVLLLSGFAFSGAAMFLLVRSVTGRADAAVIAGFVFAFLPYRFMHYAHLELQMAHWMPLSLWALHRTVAGGRLRDGLLVGLFVALQTLSSWYYGIFFVTFLIPVACALLAAAPRDRMRRAIVSLAAGALLATLLVLPFTRPYFAVRKSVGERRVLEIQFYSATPQDYLAAHPRNTIFGRLTAGWGAQERELFQGVVVPLVAAAGLWPPLSAARIGYGLGLILALETSFGLNGILYPWLHAYVLPYRGLRVPARMGIVVGLALSILVGYGIARFCARLRSRSGVSTVLAVAAMQIVVEYHTTLTLAPVPSGPPEVYGSLPSEPPPVLLELPLVVPDVALEPFYMYFSTFRWYRLVNGYSGFSPPSYTQLNDRMVGFPDDAALSELRRRGVGFIIVHGAFMSPEDYGRLTSRIDRRPDVVLAGVHRWRGRETRMYRVLQASQNR